MPSSLRSWHCLSLVSPRLRHRFWQPLPQRFPMFSSEYSCPRVHLDLYLRILAVDWTRNSMLAQYLPAFHSKISKIFFSVQCIVYKLLNIIACERCQSIEWSLAMIRLDFRISSFCVSMIKRLCETDFWRKRPSIGVDNRKSFCMISLMCASRRARCWHRENHMHTHNQVSDDQHQDIKPHRPHIESDVGGACNIHEFAMHPGFQSDIPLAPTYAGTRSPRFPAIFMLILRRYSILMTAQSYHNANPRPCVKSILGDLEKRRCSDE